MLYLLVLVLVTSHLVESIDSTPACCSLARTRDDSAIAVLLKAGKQFGGSEEEIRHYLGQPEQRRAEAVKNQLDSAQTDSVVHLHYRGIDLTLYRFFWPRRDLLVEVALSKQRGVMPFGIQVGAGRQKLLTILGKPSATLIDDDGFETLEYRGPMEDPSFIRFVIGGDQIRRIEWLYYLD